MARVLRDRSSRKTAQTPPRTRRLRQRGKPTAEEVDSSDEDSHSSRYMQRKQRRESQRAKPTANRSSRDHAQSEEENDSSKEEDNSNVNEEVEESEEERQPKSKKRSQKPEEEQPNTTQTRQKSRPQRPQRPQRSRATRKTRVQEVSESESEVESEGQSEDEVSEEEPVKPTKGNARATKTKANTTNKAKTNAGAKNATRTNSRKAKPTSPQEDPSEQSDSLHSGSDSQSESEVNSQSDSESDTGSDSSDLSDLDERKEVYFKRNENAAIEREKATVARFRYLFGLGDIFRQFIDLRAKKDKKFKRLVDLSSGSIGHPYHSRTPSSTRTRTPAPTRSKPQDHIANGRRGKTARKSGKSQEEQEIEEEEIEEFEDEVEEDANIDIYTSSPSFINGELRPYQIDGLNWLIQLYKHDLSGIFADEMGLGKTLQCISFLGYLRHVEGIKGPHLVIVPKSTVQNWKREFAQWTPQVKVCVLTGNKEERQELIQNQVLEANFDVLITSFELVIREKATMQKLAWNYIIVDEAHRIKNEESILSKIMRLLSSKHRLLITGTPLQNNLHELWALLNFLLPDVFSDSLVFDEWFAQGHSRPENEDEDNEEEENENEEVEEKGQSKVVEQLRALLSPFLLRRVKSEVEHSLLPKKEINLYVGMTEMQVKWYQQLLKKDLDAVNGGESKMRLLNVVMQLRKCCNHPYLFDGAEPGPPFTTDEHLVQNSGKMVYLDKLLKQLKKQGSRVLIFSQMARMLDILEDYCSLRDYEYCRIDGSTSHEDRTHAIDEFSKEGSNKFVFLLTTRAGGLGINLTSADQVVIYDSDWNPQADLQAMDRAHRIGQKKQVYVYRFIVEHAIEENVVERAAHKLRLDQLVIQKPLNASSNEEKESKEKSKEELVNMIRHGAQEVFDKQGGTLNNDISIEEMIKQGEKRTKELNERYSELGLDELRQFTFDHPSQQPIVPPNNLNTGSGQSGQNGPLNSNLDGFGGDYEGLGINYDTGRHHRRARNVALYEEPSETSVKSIKPPKQLVLHDYQFFSPELKELQEKELMWYRHLTGFRLSSEDFSSDEDDESEEINEKIENAVEFSEEDAKRKEELVNEGFISFTKRDFFHFINAIAKHGVQGIVAEDKWPLIVAEWPGKTIDEVKRYYKVFFARYKEIQDYERYMSQLEAGESKTRKQNERMQLLNLKVSSSRTPLSNLAVTQPSGGSSTRNRFSEANDRFLIVEMNRLGLDTDDLFEIIKERIRTCGLFDYDWFFMSRTTSEISRRCTSLLNIIAKEMNVDGKRKRPESRPKRQKIA